MIEYMQAQAVLALNNKPAELTSSAVIMHIMQLRLIELAVTTFAYLSFSPLSFDATPSHLPASLMTRTSQK